MESLSLVIFVSTICVVIGHTIDREYIYVPQFMKAIDAEQYCIDTYNTHLATVETWKQNRYIRDTCSPPGAYETTGCGPMLHNTTYFISNCGCWIGLVTSEEYINTTSRSAWEWLDSTATYDYAGGSFENWAGASDAPELFSQPNNRHGVGPTRDDQGCTLVMKGAQRVCEKLCGIPRGNGTALDRVSGTVEDGTWDDRRCDFQSMHFFCNSPKCAVNGPCHDKYDCCDDRAGMTCSKKYKGSNYWNDKSDNSDKGCCLKTGSACSTDDECCKIKSVCHEGTCTINYKSRRRLFSIYESVMDILSK